MSELERLRKALAKIAEVANAVASKGDDHHGSGDESGSASSESLESPLCCTLKFLPSRLWIAAAKTAVDINPVNAPVFGPFAGAAADLVMEPQHIALLTSKYWGSSPRKLTVSFMESTPSDLRTRILSHMNAWTKSECIEFVQTNGTGDVRISRGSGGYWSYLGTDITHIPSGRQTMNLERFTMSTPESEYRRVVRHETGHTLGFPHEHMRKALVARVDPAKAYEYFLRTQGWNKQTVDQQVLTPLDEQSLMSTPADQTSIMCYQLPGSITRDGQPIIGGVDIDQTDYDFAGRIYPKLIHAHEQVEFDDWDTEYCAK